MAGKLPFPLWIIFLGFFGVVLLAVGILGVIGSPPIALLADPMFAWSMVGIGAVLVAVETVIMLLSIMNQRR